MGASLRILVVEDSQEDMALVARELRRGGYELVLERVETPEAMKAALEAQKWDLVISDYMMPRFNGAAALTLLQKTGLDIPFIIVSGSIGEEIAVNAMKSGAHDYIMKDNLSRLIPAVERELREASQRRERMRAEKALERLTRQHQLILRSAGEGIYGLDLEGKVTFLNPAAARVLGYDVEELVGRPMHAILHHTREDGSPYLEDLCPIYATLKDGAARHVDDEVFWKRDGSSFPVEYTSSPIREQSAIIGLVVVFRDISGQKAQIAALEYHALHDSLTDLPNRMFLRERLQQALVAGRRENRPLALLLMDLDRFKEINDTLGHPNGDLLLRQVGTRIRQAAPESDTVARLGGDEFAVLFPGATVEQAVSAAEKIAGALSQPFDLESLSLGVEVSIGVALCPTHGADADLLIQRADVAMYVAKQAGSGHAVYAAEQDRYTPSRLTLISELRRAIDEGQIFLLYQPKIDLRTGRVIGVEALARWRHPNLGIVGPDRFIGLAEQIGLIKPLTAVVLEEALEQCASWSESGLNLNVAVNLSARSLQDAQLLEEIARLLRERRLSPEKLKLEITESVIMSDPARAMQILTRLNEMGVGLSIDDFGTGYSSLGYLKKLPVGEIKIDKTFVIDMATNEDDTVIVRSTIDLGHNLGLRVVAEGVENQEALARLTLLGADAVQGYYISRPLPAAELALWLKESPWGRK